MRKKEHNFLLLLNVFEVEHFEFKFRINRTGNDQMMAMKNISIDEWL